MAVAVRARKTLNPNAPEFIPSSSSSSLSFIPTDSNKPLPILHTPPPYQYPPPLDNYLSPFPNLHYTTPQLPPPPPPTFCTSPPPIFYYPNYVPNCVMDPEDQWQMNPPLVSTVPLSPITGFTDQQQVSSSDVEQKVVPEEVSKHGASKAPVELIRKMRGRPPLPHPFRSTLRKSASDGRMKDLAFKGRRIHYAQDGKSVWKPKSSVRSMNGGGESREKQTVKAPFPSRRVFFPSKQPVGIFEPIKQDSSKTTVMIKNIPNKIMRWRLMNFLDEHCKRENEKAKSESSSEDVEKVSAFDFLYLPIDFKENQNKGYAFVNFTNPTGVWKLYLYLNNYEWGLNSKKICQLTYARIQGKDALVKHFRDTNFECDSEEFLPVYFDPARDGSGGGESVKLFSVGRCCGLLHPKQRSTS